MSNLERKFRILGNRYGMRFNPVSTHESEGSSDSRSLVIDSKFIKEKVNQLKNMSDILGTNDLRGKRLLIAENSVVPKTKEMPDTNTVIAEIPKPHKDILDKLSDVNQSVQRAYRRMRRGSRCRARGKHSYGECESPNCRAPKKMDQYKTNAQPRSTTIARSRRNNTQQKVA